MSDSPAARLRALLKRPGCIVAPGVADGLAARLVAMGGFDAVYMTGFGTSITRLGMPDVGLLTATEMIDNASRIAEASNLPVIADADTGYGNPINTRRTIRDYEKAGVAGVHLEDQSWPKRCGHLAGKKVIPTAEMVAKRYGVSKDRQDEYGAQSQQRACASAPANAWLPVAPARACCHVRSCRRFAALSPALSPAGASVSPGFSTVPSTICAARPMLVLRYSA